METNHQVMMTKAPTVKRNVAHSRVEIISRFLDRSSCVGADSWIVIKIIFIQQAVIMITSITHSHFAYLALTPT